MNEQNISTYFDNIVMKLGSCLHYDWVIKDQSVKRRYLNYESIQFYWLKPKKVWSTPMDARS